MVGEGGSSRSFSSFFMWKGNHNFVTLLSESCGGEEEEGKGGEPRERERTGRVMTVPQGMQRLSQMKQNGGK